MTYNIQKLYEIAGVDKQSQGYCDFQYGASCPYDNQNCDTTCPYWVDEEPAYPPFTAEKQLELIKLLAMNFSQNCILHIDRWTSGKVRFALDKEKYTEPYFQSDYAYGDKDFSQCLAGLTLELWQDLSDNQKQEIKEILQ